MRASTQLLLLLCILVVTQHVGGHEAESQEADQNLRLGAEGTELEGEGEEVDLDSAHAPVPEESTGGQWGEAVKARSESSSVNDNRYGSAVAHFKPRVPGMLSEYVARSGFLLSRIILATLSTGGKSARWIKDVMTRISKDGVGMNLQVRHP